MKFRIIFSLFCFLPFLSWAGKEPEWVEVEFQVYLWGQPPAVIERKFSNSRDRGTEMRPYVPTQIAFYNPADESLRNIRVATGRLSPHYTYTGPGPLVFYGSNGEDGETSRHKLGSVALPEDAGSLLLLFFPTNAGDRSYNILPISSAPEDIRNGMALVYNLGDMALACQIGDVRRILTPGSSLEVDLSEVSDYQLPIQLGNQDEAGDWKIRHSERKIIRPESSYFLFIHNVSGLRDRYRILALENKPLALKLTNTQ